MQLYSTNNKAQTATLKEAVIQGLAADGGLFMPTEIPKLPEEFFQKTHSFQEISFEVAKTLLQDSIPEDDLKTIIDEAINFDAPLVNIHDNINSLELFHGPTLAFKDFGARFMAKLMQYFIEPGEKITILAATSGDTGSAVAQGFLNIPGIKVFLLYPSGKVSRIQEQQLTTIGQNVTALEVEGTFDDCQAMVKEAFNNEELKNRIKLSSANSINIARLIPQTFYYFYAYSKIKNPLVFSVPSGNLGNLTAGLIAKKMGLPVKRFLAVSNANDSFPLYITTGKYKAKPSVTTISNAMDVGNPSNFARILALYDNDITKIREDIWAKSYSDESTRRTIYEVSNNYDYILDPHGAVAYLGLTEYLKDDKETPGIFLETAHPAKFMDVVEPMAKVPIKTPERLAECLKKPKKSIKISNTFEDLKTFLLNVKLD